MNARSPLALLFSSLTIVAACSSSSSGGGGSSVASGGSSGASGSSSGGSPASIPLEQVPALVAQAECDLLNRCFGAFATVVLGTNDCLSRETKVISAGSFSSYPGLVSSGKLTYDGTQVQACIDALRAQDCAQTNSTPAVCKAVFVGKTAVGGACTENEECGADGACLGMGTCPGTCTARVPAGTACTRTADCIDGLVCDGAMMKCVTPAKVGQACNAGAPPCGGAILCFGADAVKMKPGTCKAPSDAFTAALGMPCDATTSELCVAGAFCGVASAGASGVTFQCVGPSTMGGACKAAIPESCPTGQYCNADLAMGKIDGTCTDAPADGQPCGKSVGAQVCKPGSVCDTMVCRPLQDIGGSCTSDVGCYSTNCANGTCQAGTACSKK